MSFEHVSPEFSANVLNLIVKEVNLDMKQAVVLEAKANISY